MLRALCLIVLPLSMYLSYFYVHIAILVNSGFEDGYMTTRFRENFNGNVPDTRTFLFHILTLFQRYTVWIKNHDQKSSWLRLSPF
jgi:dolichyl-phosphate-mannose--protein O-mannosyl transferase